MSDSPHHEHNDGQQDSTTPTSVNHADLLERFGTWLQRIPRNDVLALQTTQAYADFVQAFHRLGDAHRRLLSTDMILSEDVLLKILDYLNSTSLIRLGQTCSRFRHLCYKSATQRTLQMQQRLTLQNVFQLLRAKEQMLGLVQMGDSIVQSPMLGLSGRILVQNCSLQEYNGLYFCTGTNGNGFVFTKPQHANNNVAAVVVNHTDAVIFPNNEDDAANLTDDSLPPSPVLRCIIAKRFSNETLLWYMSMEYVIDDTVQQEFHFWAPLMNNQQVVTPANCRYPSFTSALIGEDGVGVGWQPLTNDLQEVHPRTNRPPIVELIL